MSKIENLSEVLRDKPPVPVEKETKDVEKQTEYVFESLQKILKETNASLDDVVKATIYVTNISDFSKISPIRNRYFANSKPVSTLVQVSALVKPECKVEIEVIAVRRSI